MSQNECNSSGHQDSNTLKQTSITPAGGGGGSLLREGDGWPTLLGPNFLFSL